MENNNNENPVRYKYWSHYLGVSEIEKKLNYYESSNIRFDIINCTYDQDLAKFALIVKVYL